MTLQIDPKYKTVIHVKGTTYVPSTLTADETEVPIQFNLYSENRAPAKHEDGYWFFYLENNTNTFHAYNDGDIDRVFVQSLVVAPPYESISNEPIDGLDGPAFDLEEVLRRLLPDDAPSRVEGGFINDLPYRHCPF